MTSRDILWRRVGAFLVDLGLWTCLANAVLIALAPVASWVSSAWQLAAYNGVMPPTPTLVAAAVIAFIGTTTLATFDIYILVSERVLGTTLGKTFYDLVVRRRGSEELPSVAACLGRGFSRWIEVCLAPVAFPLWIWLGGRIGDRLTSTEVRQGKLDVALVAPRFRKPFARMAETRADFLAAPTTGKAHPLRRLFSFYVDISFLSLLVLPIAGVVSLLILATVEDPISTAVQLNGAAWGIVLFLVYPYVKYCNRMFGATVGGRLLGMRRNGYRGPVLRVAEPEMLERTRAIAA